MAETSPNGERRQPWSPEAEISVLGAAFLDQEAVADARAEVEPRDFHRRENRVIWRAMCSIYDRGEAVDPVTLTDELKSAGALEDAGGHSYVAEILDAVPTAANVEYHVRIVREKAQLRRVIEACHRTIRDAHEANGDGPAAVVEAAERRIFEASETKRGGGFRPGKDALWKAMEVIEEESKESRGVTGVRTGIPRLDHMTAGLQPGDVIVLAGRPAMGKTALALKFACEAADAGEIVAIASLEMPDAQIVKRILAMRAEIDLMKIRRGETTQEEYDRLARASAWFSAAPIHIDDQLSATVPELRARVRRLATREDVSLVIVDYLQLMTGPGRSRVEQVSEISRGMKMMAREFEVPVMPISQLSRSPEHRSRPRPILSDLRESGSIEQDADVVLMLWRPEYYFDDQTPDEKRRRSEGKGELIVAKQRNGPTGSVWLRWDAATTRFAQLAEDHDERRAEREAGSKPWN